MSTEKSKHESVNPEGRINLPTLFNLKTECPYCGREYYVRDPFEKPVWICLKCGRIYAFQTEAKECKCLPIHWRPAAL